MHLLLKLFFFFYHWFLVILTSLLRPFMRIITLFKKEKKNGIESILIYACFYPGNAGYHYRAEKWAELWRANGIRVKILYTSDHQKVTKLTSGPDLILYHINNMSVRLIQVLRSLLYDQVIVRRSLLRHYDYGRLYMEKLLLSIHPGAILDFDDDLTNNLSRIPKTSVFGKLMQEDRFIFYRSLKLYKRFIPGSEYLAILLKNINPRVDIHDYCIVPTSVDYFKRGLKKYPKKQDVITFGWIGSNSNQVQLNKLIAPLNELSKKKKMELLVISGQEFQHEKAKFPIRNETWSLQSEITSLLQIDIGLMPLDNDKMSRAKCGFKLIQYMGLGIISIASAVTTNNRIIKNEEDGFLVTDDDKWYERLVEVCNRYNEFTEISERARQKILKEYSFGAHLDTYSRFIGIQTKIS